VCVPERVGYLPEQFDRLTHRQLPLTVEVGAQRCSLHVAHRVVEQATALARGEQRDDVRMAELGGELGFAVEALDAAPLARRWGLLDSPGTPPYRGVHTLTRADPAKAEAAKPQLLASSGTADIDATTDC
jgi:hypothetical protein